MTDSVRKYGYHPNVEDIAKVYRWRPFRRIRNLLDHLDTAYTLLDDIEAERQRLARATDPLAEVEPGAFDESGLPVLLDMKDIRCTPGYEVVRVDDAAGHYYRMQLEGGDDA